MEDILQYSDIVKKWSGYYYVRNRHYVYSYEDIEQTTWYLLIVALKEFDGRGNLIDYLNWYLKNKLYSIIVLGKKPPKCLDAPFTPRKFEYVSPEDDCELSEIFFSDGVAE